MDLHDSYHSQHSPGAQYREPGMCLWCVKKPVVGESDFCCKTHERDYRLQFPGAKARGIGKGRAA